MEFMFYIFNAKDDKQDLSPEAHLAFIRECEVYIRALKSKNHLIAAQPLTREGILLSKEKKEWTVDPILRESKVQVGYYHILAKDMDEAIEIAKDNPEFAYIPSASIEIRPVKTKEPETGFIYPKAEF